MTQHIYSSCHSDSRVRSVRARHTTHYSHKVALSQCGRPSACTRHDIVARPQLERAIAKASRLLAARTGRWCVRPASGKLWLCAGGAVELQQIMSCARLVERHWRELHSHACCAVCRARHRSGRLGDSQTHWLCSTECRMGHGMAGKVANTQNFRIVWQLEMEPTRTARHVTV